MIALVLLLQVAFPLALLVWLVLTPASSKAGWLFQAAGIAAVLFALARVAQWAVPVWWLPWVYGCLWLMVVLGQIPKLTSRPFLPFRAESWVHLALSAGLLALGGWYGARAMAGQALPPVQVVDIANPLGPGQYLVGHGGSTPLINGHLRTLDASVERFRPWRGQSYGIDFFGLGHWGFRAAGWRPAYPTAYAIFGAELRAPCAGAVVAAEGRMPDFQVPNMDPINRLGNHIILRCDAADIVMAHMRQGSLAVATGNEVVVGERLGEVGNSGASTEPHLHLHAQRPPSEEASPISGDPLSLRIEGRFLVRGDRLSGFGTPTP